MSNLIVLTKNGALLSADTAAKIADFERQKKKIDALENVLRAEIMMEMEQRGIIKAVSEEVSISYIPEGDRESFDSKAFRKDHPDLYDEYVKISRVKASIRIKVTEHD